MSKIIYDSITIGGDPPQIKVKCINSKDSSIIDEAIKEKQVGNLDYDNLDGMHFWYQLKGSEVPLISKLWKDYNIAMTVASGIQDRAMLAVVNIPVWTGNITDQAASTRLREQNNVAGKGACVKKLLLPSNDRLKKIKKIAGLARNKNYEMTFPWTEPGRRLLPTKLYSEHTSEMTKLQNEFEHELEEFFREYSVAQDEARAELGNLWKESDYPDEATLRRKFSFEISYEPIPTADNFTVMLGNADYQNIQKQLEDKAKRAATESRKILYERLQKLVNHMAEKLEDPEAKFKNSLTENIKDLTALTADLNITRDDDLDELAAELAPLGDEDPQQLRDNPLKRDEVAKTAREKAEKINERMNIFKT